MLGFAIFIVILRLGAVQSIAQIGGWGLTESIQLATPSMAPTALPSHRGTGITTSRHLYGDSNGEITLPPSTNSPHKSEVAHSRQLAPNRNVHRAETLDDYDSIVTCETERLVVVRFHAPWCKACRAMKVAYDRLAKRTPSVKFVEVSFTQKNNEMQLSLAVEAVPFGFIYHPEMGLVEKLPMSRKDFTNFKSVLHSYLNGICDLPDDFLSNSYEEYDNIIL